MPRTHPCDHGMGSAMDDCHHAGTMPSFSLTLRKPKAAARRWRLRGLAQGTATLLAALLVSTGIEAQQRKLIFQLGARTEEGGDGEWVDVSDRWIEFDSRVTGRPVQLHALWMPRPEAGAPVLLYLHGARWNVRGSLQRMQLLHSLGFSVLGIDYRGFGRSSAELPSEQSACEDALADWQWLAQNHAEGKRYVYGHSLGGAIAVQLAAQIEDASGLIIEGTFTSIPEVFGTLKWGWLPLRALITQRFDSALRVAHVKAPLLVVHGSHDEVIRPEMGRVLFENAQVPKRFLLVEGGSHHDTHSVGHFQYRQALLELFGHAT